MENYKKFFLVFLSLILLGVFLNFRVLYSSFLSDDFCLLSKIIREGPFSYWTLPKISHSTLFIRPVISLSYFVDYKIWGLKSFGFHFTNIIIHSFNSFIIFLIVFLMIEKLSYSGGDSFRMGLITSLFFLILPTHSESVVWIAGRTDLIATFFCLLSILFFMFYIDILKNNFMYFSLIFFGLALFSKEIAVMLPVIIFFIYIFSPLKKETKYFFSPIYPYLIILIFYLSFRFFALGTLIGGHGESIHLFFNLKIIFTNFLKYFLRSFIPVLPSRVYNPLSLGIILSLILLCITTVISKKLKRFLFDRLWPWKSILFFSLLAYFISIIPVINLYVDSSSPQGERFLYFPSVFSVIFIVLLINLLPVKKLVNYLFIFLLSLSFLFFLFKSQDSWITASKIQSVIINSIKNTQKTGTLFFVNVPDDINGAYIFKYGLKEAINMFDPSNQISQIVTVASQNLKNINDGVEVSKKGAGFFVKISGNYENHGTLNITETTNDLFSTSIIKPWQSYSLNIKSEGKNNIIVYYLSGILYFAENGYSKNI